MILMMIIITWFVTKGYFLSECVDFFFFDFGCNTNFMIDFFLHFSKKKKIHKVHKLRLWTLDYYYFFRAKIQTN